MTMHLLGPAFTTTNTSKRKGKTSESQYHKYCMEWLEDTRFRKKNGIKPRTMEEYIAYRQGKYNPKLRGVKAPELKISNHRELYPSQCEMGVTFAKTPNTYTGNKLIGIATLHKSNMVPVFSQEDAEDISRMRR